MGYDVVVANGLVFDGTGSPGSPATPRHQGRPRRHGERGAPGRARLRSRRGREGVLGHTGLPRYPHPLRRRAHRRALPRRVSPARRDDRHGGQLLHQRGPLPASRLLRHVHARRVGAARAGAPASPREEDLVDARRVRPFPRRPPARRKRHLVPRALRPADAGPGARARRRPGVPPDAGGARRDGNGSRRRSTRASSACRA